MRKKILHYDPNSEIRAKVKLVLESKYDLLSVGSEDKLEVLFTSEVSIFLCEFRDLSESLLERLRVNFEKTEFVVLSEASQLVDKFKAINCGFDDYIHAPVDMSEIVPKIDLIIKDLG